MTGVYFLLYNKRIVYIGATENWPVRLGMHRGIKFTEAKLFECSLFSLKKNEERLIKIFNPRHNVSLTRKPKQ